MPKSRWLVLEQVDDLHRGTGLVVVVEACGDGGVRGEQALVDALVLLVPVEDVHADLAEGCAVVGEGAVADRRAGDGREPAIEDGVLGGERGEDGQLVRREVVEDVVRVLDVVLLIEVARDEALHVGLAVGILCSGDSAEDLQIDGGEVMVGSGSSWL